jgi:hypothetical protein
VALLVNRSSVEAIVLRSPGQTYQEVDATHVSNLYTYQLINKTSTAMPIEVRLVTPGAQIKFVGTSPDSLYKDKMAQGAFFVTMETSQLSGRKTPLVFEVYSGNKKVDQVKTNFMGPGH